MGHDSKKPRPAFVEECDEEDKVVRGTKQSASTKGRTKGEKSSSSRSQRVEVLKVQSPPAERESRRKSTSTTPRSPTKSRPSLARSNVTSPPKLNTELPSRPRTDPSYFGVSQNATYTPASTSSTRSARPASYYAGMPMPVPIPTSASSVSRPPIARSAFYISPVSNMGVSYPQASPTSSYGYPPVRADPHFITESPWTQPNPLAERFTRTMDPISRTTSAQGVRALNDAFDMDPERRSVARRRIRDAEDMLPPPVPVRRQSLTRVVDSRDPYDDALRYESRPTRSACREPSPAPRPPRRPSANRGSTYDYPRDPSSYRIETSNQARRSSYYDGQRQSSDWEDKIQAAAGYQEEVGGGPPVSLTAAALRKQQRTATSSRSTRSSGSRDESDFKRSATTRTTTSRYDADGENFTIKFKGDATIKIAGAEIKCDDGAELNIVHSKGGSIRNGSERGSEYGMVPLDERSRDHHRPSTYSRSTSKSNFSNPFPARTSYQSGSFF